MKALVIYTNNSWEETTITESTLNANLLTGRLRLGGTVKAFLFLEDNGVFNGFMGVVGTDIVRIGGAVEIVRSDFLLNTQPQPKDVEL